MAKIKKTLEELLQESKYNKCNVKIGSKQGSSFWYCGKGNLTFSLPEIKKARIKTLAQNKKNMKSLIYRLEHLEEIYEETIRQAKKKGIKRFDEYVNNLMKCKEREYKLLPKRIESYQYDIDTHLLDRPVLEVVYGISPDEKPCWIIYVKGNEKGAYWTIEEYNKKKENEDED